MLIYCAHKYGGNQLNKISVEKTIRYLQTNDPDNTYISPIHTFGYIYYDVSYDKGMELCLSLLAKCDALLVLSEESEGVRLEIEYAKRNGKPMLFMRGEELWLK